MALADAPLGTTAICQDFDPSLAPFQFVQMLQGAKTYLIEIWSFPLAGTVVQTSGLGTQPLGVYPIAAETSSSSFTYGENVLRFSDTGYVTGALDNPAFTLYPGRLKSLAINRQVSLAPESYSDGYQTGTAVLNNNDRRLDATVLNNAVDGHRCRVLVGAPGAAYNQFTVIFDGVARIWSNANPDEVTVSLEDNCYLLGSGGSASKTTGSMPMQTNRYGGTGGSDGSSNLINVLKPLCYGEVANITPIQVDATNLVFQVHDGSVQAIGQSGASGSTLQVYEKGAAYTWNGNDYPTYAALVAATIAGGYYATCLAQGMFRLGSTLNGQVTCDVRGDNATVLGSVNLKNPGYVSTIPDIVVRILETKPNVPYGSANLQGWDGTFIDYDSFQAVNQFSTTTNSGTTISFGWASGTSAVNGTAGIYIDQDTNIIDVVDTLLKGIGAFWYTQRDRRFHARVLANPDPFGVKYAFTEKDILDFKQIDLPPAIYPPSWRRRVKYGKCWTVQSSDLVGSVTQDRRQFLGVDWRVAQVGNSSTRNLYLTAADPDPIDSYLRDQSDANNVASNLMALHGPQGSANQARRMFQMVVKAVGHTVEMGDSVQVTYPRFALGNGGTFRAFPVTEDLIARTVTVILWG